MCCEDSGMGKFCAGLMAGMVAGMAVGITLCPSRRELKKMTNKATRQMADLVNHLTDAMGM